MAKTAAELAAEQTAGVNPAKTMTGARALVEVDGVLIGCFDSCTWTSSVSTEAIFTLSRYSAHEIVTTAYEQVDVNCSGFRTMNVGPNQKKGGGFPMLNTLISQGSITIQIIDRQSSGAAGDKMMTIVGCVPTSYSSGVQAKSAARFQISYRGIRADYSSDAQDSESSNAVATLD